MPKQEEININVQGREYKALAKRWGKKDLPLVKKALENWSSLVEFIKKYGGRGTNLPELLSEALFCIFTGSVQILKTKGGAPKGFDTYSEKTKKTQQIKGSSRKDSPSSFGPHEKFDEVYWVVVELKKDKFTGKFEIYKLPRESIVNHPNFRRNAPAGKRPRFLLIDIVKNRNIKPAVKEKI